MVELHKGDKISNKINVLCASKVADGESPVAVADG